MASTLDTAIAVFGHGVAGDSAQLVAERLRLPVRNALSGALLVEVDVSRFETVRDVAQRVEQQAALCLRPRLMLHGGMLDDLDMTLAAAGIAAGDEILAVMCRQQRVATTSYDRTARIWNAATGQCEHVLEGHTGYVHSVAFAPDGQTLVTGSHDRTAKIWCSATSQCKRTMAAHHSYVKAVAFSPDGQCVATGSGDCSAMIWDAASGTAKSWIANYGDHSYKVYSLQGHMSSLNSVSFAPDGLHLASGSEDRTVKVWDVVSGLCKTTLKGHNSSAYVSFAPDSASVLTCSDDTLAKVWDLTTGECRRTFQGHTKFVRSAVFAPGMGSIATASGDGTAKIWDVASGCCVRTLCGHTSFVYTVAYSHEGGSVVTASNDGTARTWDVMTGKCMQVLRGHLRFVYSAAFDPLPSLG